MFGSAAVRSPPMGAITTGRSVAGIRPSAGGAGWTTSVATTTGAVTASAHAAVSVVRDATLAVGRRCRQKSSRLPRWLRIS